jgi:hypothetical protein
MSGWSEVAIGGGVESMTYVPMGGNLPRPHPVYSKDQADLYVSMGITAEKVAHRYKISREDQDAFAYHSQMKAADAQKTGAFSEIVPTPATTYVLQDNGTYRRGSGDHDHRGFGQAQSGVCRRRQRDRGQFIPDHRRRRSHGCHERGEGQSAGCAAHRQIAVLYDRRLSIR